MAKIQVDLSASLGEFSFDGQSLPEGVYPFEIKTPGVIHKSKADGDEKTIKIVLTVNDGEYKGTEKWYFRSRDLSADVGRKGLRTDLIACGVDPTKLTATTPYDEENTWNGKKGHFYFRPKSGDEQYDVLKLITPKQVAEIKARFAAGATATGNVQASGGAQKNGAVTPSVGVPQPQGAAANGNMDDL